MTNDEFKAVVAQHCLEVGAYKVSQICAEVFNDSSAEFKAHGNHEAIVHKDARIMNDAVAQMKNAHPLRRF